MTATYKECAREMVVVDCSYCTTPRPERATAGVFAKLHRLYCIRARPLSSRSILHFNVFRVDESLYVCLCHTTLPLKDGVLVTYK